MWCVGREGREGGEGCNEEIVYIYMVGIICVCVCVCGWIYEGGRNMGDVRGWMSGWVDGWPGVDADRCILALAVSVCPLTRSLWVVNRRFLGGH